MDDEKLTQPEIPPPPEVDDDLLNWMPPELVERARIYDERDAKASESMRKGRAKAVPTPPAGRNKAFSLGALTAGAGLLAVYWALAGTGANGQQALQLRGRLWFALWMAGQAAMICIYLLYLLPLGGGLRRPALTAGLTVSLAVNIAANALLAAREEGDYSMGARIVMAIFSMLVVLAVSPNVWLLLGLLRRKTAEKRAAVLGCVGIAISLIGLISTLASKEKAAAASQPPYLTAVSIAQQLGYILLIGTWPVLDRAMLSKKV